MDNEGQRFVTENRTFMAQSPDRPRRSGRELLDIAVALSAIVISLASLWIALRSDRTQDELLRSSVWPYVEYDTSDTTETGARRLVYLVRNDGVGPAIVRSFAVSYDGRYVATLGDLLRACCGARRHSGVLSSSVLRRVIMAHDTIPFIVALPGKTDARTYAALGDARARVTVEMCYCSVLGDCWFLHTTTQGSNQPAAVHACPPARQPQYVT